MPNGKDIVKIAAVAGGAYLLKSALGSLFEYDLKDKTVLITGGSRGLGLVMAREFAREGARLALCARDDEELERARLDRALRSGEIRRRRNGVSMRRKEPSGSSRHGYGRQQPIQPDRCPYQ